MSLAEFLLARISDVEALARAAMRQPKEADAVQVVWYRHDDGWTPSAHGDWAEGQALLDHFNPAFVLAECEAKRRIVLLANAARDDDDDLLDQVRVMTLRLLALPHADHPDYREEWKP